MEGLYYPCSENKGADQLRGYREADLRLCFLHMQKAGFLITRLKSDRVVAQADLSLCWAHKIISVEFASHEDSDQPRYLPSLIKVSAVNM